MHCIYALLGLNCEQKIYAADPTDVGGKKKNADN